MPICVTDIADYIGRYSDHIHHPQEDKVYETLAQCTSECQEALDQLGRTTSSIT